MTHQLPEDERAEVNTRLSIFLEEKRKESGMTAEEFANSLGMSRQTLANFKKSRAFPSVETILNIKKKYADLSLDSLIAGDEPIEAKVTGQSNGGSEIVRYQSSEVERLVKQATEKLEAEARKYKEKYEALADKVLAKAGFNWVTGNTTGANIDLNQYPYAFYRNLTEKEVSVLVAPMATKGRS